MKTTANAYYKVIEDVVDPYGRRIRREIFIDVEIPIIFKKQFESLLDRLDHTPNKYEFNMWVNNNIKPKTFKEFREDKRQLNSLITFMKSSLTGPQNEPIYIRSMADWFNFFYSNR